jgi:uncharacterized NAD-dependent epimerase/dehydratase family protein
MKKLPEGNAIVYCEGAFNTPNGKTAHGLIRFTKRYKVLCIIDSKSSGKDSGLVLDGKENRIPVLSSLKEAKKYSKKSRKKATYFVVGLAPDGGRLSKEAKQDIKKAIKYGLNVDSGLHDFLTEDKRLIKLARKHKVKIRDIRKPPSRNKLHFFSGNIEKVKSLKVALLGTDSAVGKRTTAWILVNALNSKGYKTELIGTGQTAWLQGAKYSLVLDSLINDFVSGEIEHAVYTAWKESKPDVIVIEGQGSLMNPAYPGGFEILAAGRPDVVVLQHAPARKDYDGFPGYPLHPLSKQLEVVKMLSRKPIVAITINHEDLNKSEIPTFAEMIEKELGIPAYDVLLNGGDALAETVLKYKPVGSN